MVRAPLVQASTRPRLMPSEAVLALHDTQKSYFDFAKFKPEIPSLLHQGALGEDCLAVIQRLGMIEPLTGAYVPPGSIDLSGTNYREAVVANGLLSRNRAVLKVLEGTYGSVEALTQQRIYLVEAISGFASWMRRRVGDQGLICSEFLDESEIPVSDIPHQDLCELSFSNQTFDLVLCNELFEHVRDLGQAFSEIHRVLKAEGRLIATCPLAFGQRDSILKARLNQETGEPDVIGEPEHHGDPVRPGQGSLVYRIPGWEILDQLQCAGFKMTAIHHICSWKHGILGSDLPGVLVIEAQR
jgi:SAM-dependent methyltransferase